MFIFAAGVTRKRGVRARRPLPRAHLARQHRRRPARIGAPRTRATSSSTSSTPPPARCATPVPGARMPATPPERPPRPPPRPAQRRGLRRPARPHAARPRAALSGRCDLMPIANRPTSNLQRQRPPPPPRHPHPRPHDGLGRPLRHAPARRHGRRGHQGRVRALVGHAALAALPQRLAARLVEQGRLLQPQQPQQVRHHARPADRARPRTRAATRRHSPTSSSRTTAPTSSASSARLRRPARRQAGHHPRLDAEPRQERPGVAPRRLRHERRAALRPRVDHRLPRHGPAQVAHRLRRPERRRHRRGRRARRAPPPRARPARASTSRSRSGRR